MVSTRCLIFAFSIVQCGMVVGSTSASQNSSIPVSALVAELRQEPFEVRLTHLSYMSLVGSYGDQLYDLAGNVSADCATAIRANSLMYETLAIGREVSYVTYDTLISIAQDLQNDTLPEEHPLELFCRRIAKAYAENGNLSGSFEKAKNEAAQSTVVGRPPYHRELLKSNAPELLRYEFVEKLTVPELARVTAVASFVGASELLYPNSTVGILPRHYFFARSCQGVAQQGKYTDLMQSSFDRTMNDTIPEIGVDNRHRKIIDGYWWLPKMMKTFYGYLASDANLKQELESMGRIVGKNESASDEDLDFSKL